jgi:hypothetical protein
VTNEQAGWTLFAVFIRSIIEQTRSEGRGCDTVLFGHRFHDQRITECNLVDHTGNWGLERIGLLSCFVWFGDASRAGFGRFTGFRWRRRKDLVLGISPDKLARANPDPGYGSGGDSRLGTRLDRFTSAAAGAPGLHGARARQIGT